MKIKIHLTLSKALFAVLSLCSLFALANPKEARAEVKELELSHIADYEEYKPESGNLELSPNKEYKLIIDADNVEINTIKANTFVISQSSGIKLTIEGNSDNSDYTLTCNKIADINNLVINSGKIKVNVQIDCYNLMITGGSLEVERDGGTGIWVENEMIIKGGKVISHCTGGGGIDVTNKLLISGGDVDVYGTFGISMGYRGKLEISGKETKVKASGYKYNYGRGGIAILGGIQEQGAELKLVKPVKISAPEGGCSYIRQCSPGLWFNDNL